MAPRDPQHTEGFGQGEARILHRHRAKAVLDHDTQERLGKLALLRGIEQRLVDVVGKNPVGTVVEKARGIRLRTHQRSPSPRAITPFKISRVPAMPPR